MSAGDSLDWLIHTDGGLAARVAVGSTIFAVLALVDLHRNGSRATRWREYLFLLAVVGVSLVYGAVNDQITSRISWEYFFYGKGLAEKLGPAVPPNAAALSWEATKIGLKATWSAGLIIGVALLLANNPARNLPQLSSRRLLKYVPMTFSCCVVCAAILGAAGYRGLLTPLSSDFAEMRRTNEFRPSRFMAVYGIHLGGYVGGAIGSTISYVSIRQARKRLRKEPA